MFCPSCGQEQISEEIKFCSRCGLLLTGVTEILNLGGALPQSTGGKSLKKRFFRKKGLRQGLFIFLLTFLIVPIVSIITIALRERPFVVIICAILFSVGGLLRMAYSLLFEENDEDTDSAKGDLFDKKKNYFGKSKTDNSLPSRESVPASNYIPAAQGNWRDTNDLEIPSVTDGTTKLLKEDEL